MKKINNIMNILSIFYLTFPIIIFSFYWLKLPIAIIFSATIIFFSYSLYKNISNNILDDNKKKIIIYWLICIIIVLVWVYLSGIGSYSYQRYDFFVRNPIFNDLNSYEWPIIYDYSSSSLEVQQVMGNNSYLFVYYFIWWLPVSFIVKLFNFNMQIANLLLFLYSVFGLLLLLYNLTRYFKKRSYVILIVLILFSGLDILFWNGIGDMEWWCNGLIQYSSNTTLLYYCFNQAIPIWLIISILLRLKNNKTVFALLSLVLVYSPWAAIGALFFIVDIFVKNIKKWKNLISPVNIITPISVLLIFGLFYAAGNSGTSFGINISFDTLYLQILFILFECGIYLLFLYKLRKKLPFFKVVLLELIIFPFIYSYPFGNNFTMRSSILAIFMLSIYIMYYFLNENSTNIKKLLLIIVFGFGALNPMMSFCDSIINMNYQNDPLQSFQNINIDNDDNKELADIVKKQFLNKNYKNTLFYKYIMRK